MKKNVKDALIQLIADTLKVDKNALLEASSLQDLGADSLAVLEVLAEIEDKFGISIPDEDINKIVNLHEAVAYVEKKLEIKDAG